MNIVVFDAFGTLISYAGRRTNPYRHLMGQIGTRTHRDASSVRRRPPFLTKNVPVDVFAEECGLASTTAMIRRELEVELSALQLFGDVAPTLQALRTSGIRIGICSNLAAEYGSAVRRLLPDMDAYVLSYEVGACKPDPAIYRAVCVALSCEPGEVLFVGDSRRSDVDGPRAYGMQARLINRKVGETLPDVLQLEQLAKN